ncbi:hypothetical protein SteCoe_34811 [Stentor coeruleus]|uniref:Uncharacterized protein n=1 Tax=Stentor coeruleus TaxID=5963 RepID=A0A1R2ATP7_9CILI|nr:hypothetical protein SteCoe_34811 [Stentor coeruleus]
MKSFYLIEEEEEKTPILISETNYLVFKSDNMEKISNSSGDSLLLDDVIVEENWGWIYSNFSRTKLIWKRTLYSISYIFQSFCFIISLFMNNNYMQPVKAPFSIDPYFKMVTWCFVLLMGFPFLRVIYSNSVSGINILSWSINLLYLPVYFLLSFLFIHRAVSGVNGNPIMDDIVLGFAMILTLIIYYRVKYKDDGRYKVGIIELLGVQVHFSALLACLLVEICESVFRTCSRYHDADKMDSKLFGWSYSNWSILVIILTCWTGSLILYLYKDVFYAGVMSFTYFGIYSVQERYFCYRDDTECNDSVGKASIIMASILLFFILITIITYPKLVLYSVRRNS